MANSEPLTRVFKKFRKSGYTALQSLTRKVYNNWNNNYFSHYFSHPILQKEKYIFFCSTESWKVLYLDYSNSIYLNICYKGDIDEIQAIFESEGFLILLPDQFNKCIRVKLAMQTTIDTSV